MTHNAEMNTEIHSTAIVQLNTHNSIRGKWFDLSNKEMRLLDEALTYHSDGYTDADITVQTCWDADRLDLGRVGVQPSEKKLCTQTAKNAIKKIV